MPRRISSLGTLPSLVSGPVIIVIGIGFLIFRLTAGGDHGPFEPSISFALYVIFIGAIDCGFVWFFGFRRVRLDDNNLYVSDYRKEITIPLSEIADVTENRWLNAHPVTISLRNPTEFGDKIVFMPTLKYFVFFTGHPIVGELLNAAAATRPDEFSYREFD
jgi:hypothetical protein